MRIMIAAFLAITAMMPMADAADTKPSVPAPAFSVPDLAYGYNALNPVIDTETMKIHHDKHHQAYVDNLNTAVREYKDLQDKSIEQILQTVSKHDATVRNNAGGHYNHSLYWTLMAPQGKGGAPSKEFLAQINKDFGSLDAFKTQFETAGTRQFGSGWVWLVWDGSKLVVASTANQDNPLMDDAKVKGFPVMGNDVWEHAYYLKYQNKRADYLHAWWNIVNWNTVNNRFATAEKK